MEELFNSGMISALWIPAATGLGITVVLYFLRNFLYSRIRKMAARTTTSFDDILVRDTRLITVLWCVWFGIWAGWNLAETRVAWDLVAQKLIPILFVALGIYTLVVVIMTVFKWYKKDICPRTSSSLDEVIMGTLITGTPVVGSILGVILILNMLGIEQLAPVNLWLSDHLANMAILVVMGVILLLATILIVPRVIETGVRNSRAEQSEDELKKRADTLNSVIITALQAVIIIVTFFMILGELSIEIGPLLAGAGVVGIALGFGAQSLVKDIISGLFVIMENQYRKGDVIKIADVSGVVEEINLRRTILRDADGVYHVVPNGQIAVASNYTKQLSKVNLDISVAYETDLDKAMAVVNRVGKELAEDPQWMPFILTPPKALRINKLGDSGIDIKIVCDTRPSKQWDIAGELRLRLKKAFDKEGIEIPYPHTMVYFGNSPQSAAVEKN